MKSLFIRDIANDSLVRDVFALDSKNLIPFKNKPGNFLKLTLSDKTGEITAKIWDDAENILGKIADSKFVHIIGTTSTYRGEIEITIKYIEPVDIEDINPGDFLPTTPKDIKEMNSFLKNTIDNIGNSYLKELLNSFCKDSTLVNNFTKAPAAKKFHQPYLGGLLEHTTNMLRLVPAVCESYPEIDRDLLTTGVILHDIGKTEEYQYDICLDISSKGRFLGHIIIGIEMVNRKIEEIKGFPGELRMKLLHMIASHHGRHEWQSPEEPKFLEARILHHLDQLDADAYQFTHVEKNSTDDWVYSNMLKQWVYVREEKKEEPVIEDLEELLEEDFFIDVPF